MRHFLETLEAVVQYQAQNVLFDGRTLKGKPHDLERFLYGEFAAKETMRLSRNTDLLRGLPTSSTNLFATQGNLEKTLLSIEG